MGSFRNEVRFSSKETALFCSVIDRLSCLFFLFLGGGGRRGRDFFPHRVVVVRVGARFAPGSCPAGTNVQNC